jgi:hypothetical protein
MNLKQIDLIDEIDSRKVISRPFDRQSIGRSIATVLKWLNDDIAVTEHDKTSIFEFHGLMRTFTDPYPY